MESTPQYKFCNFQPFVIFNLLSFSTIGHFQRFVIQRFVIQRFVIQRFVIQRFVIWRFVFQPFVLQRFVIWGFVIQPFEWVLFLSVHKQIHGQPSFGHFFIYSERGSEGKSILGMEGGERQSDVIKSTVWPYRGVYRTNQQSTSLSYSNKTNLMAQKC